jgi:hypothetical protein
LILGPRPPIQSYAETATLYFQKEANIRHFQKEANIRRDDQRRRTALETNLMQFVSDYMKAIDFIALAALVVIAAASLYRRGTIWLLIAAIVVAIWGASRLFGFF